MHVVIVGAGAMGSIFGAAIAESGAQVSLVDPATPVVDAVRKDGVVVTREDAERATRVTVSSDAVGLPTADMVFFFVKCYHTSSAAKSVEPIVNSNSVIVSLQNGWGNGDVLATHFDERQVVVGVTYNSGTVLAPGRVAHTGQGTTHVGPLDASSPAVADRVRDLLESANLPTETSPSIRSEIWRKLVLNAATLPTSALTGLTAGALGRLETTAGLVDAVSDEAVAVCQAAGYDIEYQERRDRIHAVLAGAGDGKASMLQDFEAGRRSEIEVITGAIVAEAEKFGIPVPINRALLALVLGAEHARGLR